MKKNKQLNLYFKDQPFEKKNNTSDKRVNLILSFFFLFFLVVFFRLVALGLNKTEFIEKEFREDFFYERRDIVDRKGKILSKNIIVHDLVLRKNKTSDIGNILLKAKLNFPSLDYKKINNKLKKKKILILKRNLSQLEYNQVILLGEPALELISRETRIYPQQNLFSHILGQVDTDGNGISGLEMYLDDEIKNKSKLQLPVYLSLDLSIQYLVYKELKKGIKNFSAKGASAILLNAETGKLISMVSLPDFNNNQRLQNNSDILLNKNTKSLYELGSVFKTFAIASAIDNQIISKETLFKNLRNRVYCGRYPIDEYRWDKSKKNLNTEQILVKSSNIGTIEIIKKNGVENHQNFLEKLEIFDLPKLEVMELSKSVKNKWGFCNTLTSGYGHGINTTPLQFTRAFAAIINGGYLVDSSLLINNRIIKKKIIKSETSKVMNQILRANVNIKNKTAGSGRKADIQGYEVIGKTGTAQKPSKNIKGYSSDIVNVFVAAFPASKPRYVLTVLIDEPQGAPDLWNHNRREAGWNAAHIAGQIIQNIGPTLATNDSLLVQSYKKNK